MYGKDHKDLLHYYTTELDHESLMSNYTLWVLVDEVIYIYIFFMINQDNVELIELQDNKVSEISSSLESCINNYFAGEYYYNS